MSATNGHGRHVNDPGAGAEEALPGVPPLLDAIRADLEQMAKVKETPYPSIGGAIDVLSIPGTWAVILFRLASAAHFKGIRPLSRFIYFLNLVLFGAELHPGAIVGPGLVIPHPVSVAFASGCRAGARLTLLRGSGMGGAGNPKRPGLPVLGDDVSLMDSARVLGPVHVGDRTIIGLDAVVVDDIPADMFVYGVTKSDRMRPLAELGLGQRAEAELGYGRGGRLAGSATSSEVAESSPAGTSDPATGAATGATNGLRPTAVT